MAKELIWSNENEYVYGRKVEFTSITEFEAEVKCQYEDGECNTVGTTIEPCIVTERTISGGHLVPLSLSDYIIENYYMTRVVPVE